MNQWRRKHWWFFSPSQAFLWSGFKRLQSHGATLLSQHPVADHTTKIDSRTAQVQSNRAVQKSRTPKYYIFCVCIFRSRHFLTRFWSKFVSESTKLTSDNFPAKNPRKVRLILHPYLFPCFPRLSLDIFKRLNETFVFRAFISLNLPIEHFQSGEHWTLKPPCTE